jgi:hypothetical protein
VAPSGEPGAFSNVAFIRRSNATGGASPGRPCTARSIGHGARSDYAAEYTFFAPTRP